MEKNQKYEADYLIDYEKGNIPISELPIGDRVVDPSWEWEFRAGPNYSEGGDVRPVTWIIVGKNHYDGLEPHVTLLAEELIAIHVFDNSTDRDHKEAKCGYSHWGASGTANATHGLRPWLNSTGIHSDEGFYQRFSERFKEAVLVTALPNREWQKSADYSTNDYVFIPSITELGINDHGPYIPPIGSAYPYYSGEGEDKSDKRVARFGGKTSRYWTRSPDSRRGIIVCTVTETGSDYWTYASWKGLYGVRPALNLKSGVLVSEIKK